MTRLQRTTPVKAPSLLLLVIFQYFQLSKFYRELRAGSGAYLIEELSPDNTPSCKLSTANKKLNMLMEIDLTKERNFFEFSNLQSCTNSIKRFEALESQKKQAFGWMHLILIVELVQVSTFPSFPLDGG